MRRADRYDVVFYAPWMGPLLSGAAEVSSGGAETQMHLLTQALASRGWRVAVVVHDDPGLPDRVGGVDVVRQATVQTTRRVIRTAAYAAALLRALLPLRADVVVQRGANTSTGVVGLIARLRGSRFVFSSANDFDFDYARVESRRLSVAIVDLGIRLAGAIVVQNAKQQRLCRQKLGRPSHVIKSVAEPAAGPPGRPEAFLWVGRLAWYKRPLAFVELARAVPEARFRMVGVASGPGSEEAARELAEAAQGLPNLELLAPRPRHELLELVGSAVAMVSTSDADSEGMPNVFLEAWVRGVPALALAHDLDGVLAREGVGGFAGGSPERLADLARDLWASRHDREELAERCRAHARREHAPDAVIDRWTAVLSRPASRPSG